MVRTVSAPGPSRKVGSVKKRYLSFTDHSESSALHTESPKSRALKELLKRTEAIRADIERLAQRLARPREASQYWCSVVILGHEPAAQADSATKYFRRIPGLVRSEKAARIPPPVSAADGCWMGPDVLSHTLAIHPMRPIAAGASVIAFGPCMVRSLQVGDRVSECSCAPGYPVILLRDDVLLGYVVQATLEFRAPCQQP